MSCPPVCQAPALDRGSTRCRGRVTVVLSVLLLRMMGRESRRQAADGPQRGA